MERTSSAKIAEALRLLEEAATQKKDELKSVLSGQYAHLKNLIVETEKDLVRSVSDTVDATVQSKSDDVKKARDLALDVDKNVRHNPWAYIAGTAAIGVLLGYIFGRDRA